MNNLREKVIRLAHENPELRKDLLPLLKEAGRTQTYGVAGQDIAGWYVSVHHGDNIVGDYRTVKKVVQAVEKGWLMEAAKDFAARVKKQLGVLPKISGHKEHVSIDLEFMIDDADEWFASTGDFYFDWIDRWAKKWNLELE